MATRIVGRQVITDIRGGGEGDIRGLDVVMMSTYDVKVEGCLHATERGKTIKLKLTILDQNYLYCVQNSLALFLQMGGVARGERGGLPISLACFDLAP